MPVFTTHQMLCFVFMRAKAMLIMGFACGAVGTAAAEIRGVVMGPNGRPLAYATIVDHPVDHPIAAILPEAKTDLSGKFRLRVDSDGRHELWAYRESAGVPRIMGTLWAQTNPPTVVTVRTSDSAIDNVVVRTGPAVAWVSGRILSTPANDVALRLELAEDPAPWEERPAAQEFRAAIPANVLVRLSVSRMATVVVPAQAPGAEVHVRIAPQHGEISNR